MPDIDKNRRFLKTYFSDLDGTTTDAKKGLPKPAAEKQWPADCKIIDLPEVDSKIIKNDSLFMALKNRRSIRKYADSKLTLGELSYLLWATNGVNERSDNGSVKRTIPSGGASYSIEEYVIVQNVEGLVKGVYNYLPVQNKLVFIKPVQNITETIDSFMLDSKQPFLPYFARKAAAIFAWTTIPYRSEYKFDVMAHKKILIDVGHVCQNLYIASEGINSGTCAIGIYDQDMVDKLLEVDGKDEFTVYLAAVGRNND